MLKSPKPFILFPYGKCWVVEGEISLDFGRRHEFYQRVFKTKKQAENAALNCAKSGLINGLDAPLGRR